MNMIPINYLRTSLARMLAPGNHTPKWKIEVNRKLGELHMERRWMRWTVRGTGGKKLGTIYREEKLYCRGKEVWLDKPFAKLAVVLKSPSRFVKVDDGTLIPWARITTITREEGKIGGNLSYTRIQS